jgi:hypothetical protein
MNEQLVNFARQELKNGLAQLPLSNKTMFKRMYSYKNLDLDINAVVDNIPEEKLDLAIRQVKQTIDKRAANKIREES